MRRARQGRLRGHGKAGDRRLEGVDILINNAAISRANRIMEIAPADYDEVTEVNLRGTLYISQALIPHFRTRGSGVIVCLASVAAQRGGGIFGGPHYAASEGGVLALAKAMARELAGDGIRVNATAPSMIDTDIFQGQLSEERLPGPAERGASRAGPPEHSDASTRPGARRRRSVPVPRLGAVLLRHRSGDRRQRRLPHPLKPRPRLAARSRMRP